MIFAACEEPAARKEGTALRPITIAQFGHVFIYLPLYVAKQKGFFREQGLDVQFLDTGGDDKTFAALIGGSASFGVADPTFAAISAEHGQAGRVVAQVVGRVSFWGITERPDLAAIRRPQDLSGLTVATYPAPSTNYALLREYLSRSPNISQRVTIREAAFGTLLALLKSGQADVIMELEPTTSLAVSQGGKVVFSYAKEYGDFAFTGLTTLPATIEKDPDLVFRVVSALEKSLSAIHQDPAMAKKIAKLEFPDLNEQIISSAVDRLLSEEVLPRHAEMPMAAWQSAIKLRRSIGDLRGEPADSIVDGSFARRAQRP
jgi:NitT/TauT family transport system substrate-binding protein